MSTFTRAVLVGMAALPASAQTELWVQQFGTTGWDYAYCASPDGASGVYAGGYTAGSISGSSAGLDDVWLARFDGAGHRLWLRQFGTSAWDQAFAAVSDSAGGVYVGGITHGDLGGAYLGGSDAWLARFDGLGNQLWVVKVATALNDSIASGAPDGAGGAFFCGNTGGDLGAINEGLEDAWLARFDSSGNLLWTRQFGTPNQDWVRGAAPDGSGGLYVCGSTTGSLVGQNAGGFDAWLARYDSTGQQLWLRQLGSSSMDHAQDIQWNAVHGVLVGGSTLGSFGGVSSGGWDAWLAQFDDAGLQTWIKQFGTSSNDAVTCLELDEFQGLYVVGVTSGDLGGPAAGGDDVWLARYDTGGQGIWIQQFGTNMTDQAPAAVFDGAGGLHVVGSTYGSLAQPNAGSVDIYIARYDGYCNPGTTYCVASSTSIPGCTASLSAIGSPTLSDPSAWTVSSGPVPGGNLGLLLFGSSGPDSTPYGTLGGKLCVGSPTFRTAPKPSGGDSGQCNGSYTFTLADLIAASPIVTSGAAIHAQVWARDPANQDGFLLSDGLEVTVCP